MGLGETIWMAWWGRTDWVVRGVFVLLVGLSVLSWTVILYKTLQLERVLRAERRARALLYSPEVGAGVLARLPADSVSRAVAQQLQSLPASDMALFLEGAAQIQTEHRTALESYLTLLATVGNTAPFIGLLGTVWGIMHALQTLGASALTIEAVAGPVGEALAATAAGLFTAIPAVVGYNLLLRRLRQVGAVSIGNGGRIVLRLVSGAAAVD